MEGLHCDQVFNCPCGNTQVGYDDTKNVFVQDGEDAIFFCTSDCAEIWLDMTEHLVSGT